MLNQRLLLAAVAAAALFALPLLAANSPPAASPVDSDRVLDQFVAAVEADMSIAPERRKAAGVIVAALRTDADGKSVAITEVLRVLHPDFKEALAALGEGNLGVAITKLTTLRESADPFVAGEATYYLARAYLLDERFEDCLPLLADLQSKWSAYSTHGGEVLFLRGVAEVALLRHPEAMDTLSHFLSLYPEAPERMRVGAFRQLEQLKLFEEGTLSDVSLRMDFSRRKLSLEDTGLETRQQQDKIIDILAKLIKAAEERECNCKGGGSGKGQKPSKGKGGEGESQAQGEGQGQGG
ncbi:MAG: hypothetical protein WD872_12690, partial [Pirellulaceae bacterium]